LSSQPAPLAREQSADAYVELNAAALHDLVGPANQVRWMVDLLLKKHRDHLDEDDQQLFGFLNSASERLQILVSGLRTYLRAVGQNRPHLEFDCNEIFAQVLAALRESIEESAASITSDYLPRLYGDSCQICSALTNLIENAIKFRGDRRPEIHLQVVKDGSGWRFSVSDNGIGIDAKHRERVFEVFKRLHEASHPGAGVGLTIAKRIIERHGGRIWVESRIGQGSTFFFTLPGIEASGTAHPAGI
jgi:light-regulated signal transduction histidine kinase (bacteriophytochrome)